jgi:polar amino acid transport system substrate-binding protein
MRKIGFLISIFILSYHLTYAAEKLVVVTGEWPPYTGESMDNKGFVSEIVTKVIKSMNMEVEIRFYPWRRCYQYVLWDKAWAAYPYSFTEERAKEVEFSDDVAFSTTKFFYHSRSGQKPTFLYNELSDLRQYQLGGVIGYYYEEQFKQAKLNIDYVAKEKMALEKLFLGRFQLLPLNEMVGWELIRSIFPNNVNQFGSLDKPLDRKSLKLIVKKKNQKSLKLLEKFNTQLKQFMQSKTYQLIIDKYTGQ